MSELLSFAASVLELNGALVDRPEGAVEAVLPEKLRAELMLPEHVRLTEREEGRYRLGYGSEVLERMVSLSTSRLVVASARLGCNARPSGAEQAASAFSVRNGVCTAGSPTLVSNRRLWVHAAYAVMADERREGVVSAVVSLGTGTEVAGFEAAAQGALEPGPPCDLGRDAGQAAALAAVRLCSAQAELETEAFRAAMRRRHERDRERLDAYFADLLGELDARTMKGKLEPKAAAEKREVLHREKAAKLEALAARYDVRLEVSPIAALVVECPGFRIAVSVRRRKAERTIELEYDGPTRHLVPPRCEACLEEAPRPAACDDAVHLLCEKCAPRAAGRIHCPACTGLRAQKRNEARG